MDTTTTTQERTMNATPPTVQPYGGTGRRTPSTNGYSSQASAALDPAYFMASLFRAAEGALNVATNGIQAELMDYLAARTVTQGPESRRVMDDLLAASAYVPSEQRRAVWSHTRTEETEAGRALVVGLGLNVQALAPIDFPTIARYWIACRNAYGHRF